MSKRAGILQIAGMFAISTLLSLPVQAPAADPNVPSKSREKDRVECESVGRPLNARTPMPGLDHLCLWLQLNWSQHGLSTECKPILDGKGPQLSKTELQQFWTQTNDNPRVTDLVNGWHKWYDDILAVVRKAAGNKTPTNDMHFKLSVTVNADRTIAVFTDFADGKDSKKAEQYTKKIKNALSKLDKKEILTFPKGTLVKQTRFEIQSGGFDNLELTSIGQSLGLQ